MSDLTTILAHTNGRGFTTSARPDNDRVFRRAMRHSRLVRMLRVATPIALVMLIVGIVVATWFEPLRVLARLPGSADHVVVSGTKITMAAPKLSGFTRDGRRYDLTARTATQDITKPDILEMEDITAKFETQDKTQLDITALTGHYDRKSGMLTLRRDVVLISSNGYQVNLDEVRADTGTGTVVSETPVQVNMLQGTLNSKRMEVHKSGELIIFDGGVKMKMIMNPPNATPEKPNQP